MSCEPEADLAKLLGRIHQGDCIRGLKKIPDGSIHLVFADPPFNIGYEYDVYKDNRAYDEYLAWSERWMREVARVLRPDGTFWLAIGDEFAAELKLIAQRQLGLHCRSWVIWYYTFGVNCTKKFSRSHTHLFHFVKDKRRFTFNAAFQLGADGWDARGWDVRVPSARMLVYGDGRANEDGRLPDDTWVRPPDALRERRGLTPPLGGDEQAREAARGVRDGWFLRPQDVPGGFSEDQDTWYFSRVAGTFKERAGFHGCQMPERLLARIIHISSNPGRETRALRRARREKLREENQEPFLETWKNLPKVQSSTNQPDHLPLYAGDLQRIDPYWRCGNAPIKSEDYILVPDYFSPNVR